MPHYNPTIGRAASQEAVSSTPIETLVVFLGVLIVLFAAWVAGVVMLFNKGWRTLGMIALAGIVIPLVGLVGFAGWFVGPVER